MKKLITALIISTIILTGCATATTKTHQTKNGISFNYYNNWHLLIDRDLNPTDNIQQDDLVKINLDQPHDIGDYGAMDGFPSGIIIRDTIYNNQNLKIEDLAKQNQNSHGGTIESYISEKDIKFTILNSQNDVIPFVSFYTNYLNTEGYHIVEVTGYQEKTFDPLRKIIDSLELPKQ